MQRAGFHHYLRVVLPGNLPPFFMRRGQGWTLAFRALITGKMVSAAQGVGQMCMVGRDLSGIGVGRLIACRLQTGMRQQSGMGRA